MSKRITAYGLRLILLSGALLFAVFGNFGGFAAISQPLSSCELESRLQSPSQTETGNFYKNLSDAAMGLTADKVVYDPSYFSIPYPGGDVPADRGVCTDVVIRAYRKVGIDLQKEVHEDMKANFDLYPKIWGLSRTDRNIDHRRVPNLMVFFERFGTKLRVTDSPTDYLPGDVVCWKLSSGQFHIGIVSSWEEAGQAMNLRTKNPPVVHNIGYGQVAEDCLFRFELIGHYRYGGE